MVPILQIECPFCNQTGIKIDKHVNIFIWVNMLVLVVLTYYLFLFWYDQMNSPFSAKVF